jgi:MFS transporter, OCT family, solute carrier family 22 (organic cation transporter), member 4/5
MVGKESRLNAGIIIQFFFPAGYIIMAGIAYLIHDWRWLQVAITIPGVFFLFYWWFIPESTRWLLGQMRRDEAIEQIQKVAKANNLKVPREVLDKLEVEEEKVDKKVKNPSLLDLFRTPNLRTKSLLIFFDWFVISGTYYGLSWSTNDLGDNKYLNFIIGAAVEFPANYFLILTLDRWGRKKILTGSMVASGAALLLSLIVPQSLNWLKISLAMFGKMSVTAAYGTIYIFSVEQFPTVIRNVALGACSMSARLGGVSAPYLLFLKQFWKPAPFFIFGICAFLGGFCSTFLPETCNQQLPETLADSERLGKDKETNQQKERRPLK